VYQYAATAAQNALGGSTNTDAVIYYDDSIPEPKYIANGMVSGVLMETDVLGMGGNYIPNDDGSGQFFYKYSPQQKKKK
jgi:hypothetical protein